MVRAARAWRNIYVVNVDGRVVNYGGNGLKFEEVVTRNVDRQGKGVYCTEWCMRKARPPPALRERSFLTRE